MRMQGQLVGSWVRSTELKYYSDVGCSIKACENSEEFRGGCQECGRETWSSDDHGETTEIGDVVRTRSVRKIPWVIRGMRTGFSEIIGLPRWRDNV